MNVTGACLQLDVGNSSVKWRLVRRGQISHRGSYHRGDESEQEVLLHCTDTLDHIWIASVAAPATETELAALLQEQWGIAPWFARTQARTGSLRNSYDDPARMGVDRWLAMLGARERERGKLCVIDAGSALTIDIVSAAGQHEGGYIIPGAALMERALLLDTDQGSLCGRGRLRPCAGHLYSCCGATRYHAGAGRSGDSGIRKSRH